MLAFVGHTESRKEELQHVLSEGNIDAKLAESMALLCVFGLFAVRCVGLVPYHQGLSFSNKSCEICSSHASE